MGLQEPRQTRTHKFCASVERFQSCSSTLSADFPFRMYATRNSSTKGLTFAWHSSVSSVSVACPVGKSSTGGSHFHEHAVVSGSSTLRYSSTHRVADTDGNTFSHVQKRCEEALAGGGAAAGGDDQILNLAQVRLLCGVCRLVIFSGTCGVWISAALCPSLSIL